MRRFLTLTLCLFFFGCSAHCKSLEFTAASEGEEQMSSFALRPSDDGAKVNAARFATRLHESASSTMLRGLSRSTFTTTEEIGHLVHAHNFVATEDALYTSRDPMPEFIQWLIEERGVRTFVSLRGDFSPAQERVIRSHGATAVVFRWSAPRAFLRKMRSRRCCRS